jgi:hypothetical protein
VPARDSPQIKHAHDHWPGTPTAAKLWKVANDTGNRQRVIDFMGIGEPKRGGLYRFIECDSTAVKLVPDRYIEGQPFIVLFHRTQVRHSSIMEDKKGKRNKLSNSRKRVETLYTIGGSGHYEAMVVNMAEEGEEPRYEGYFDVEHEMYPHLRLMAQRLHADTVSDIASQRMASDFDAKHAKVTEYSVGDAVGVHHSGSNPRKGAGSDRLPCLVARIKEDTRDKNGGKSTFKMYKLWCEFGVIDMWFKVDKLTFCNRNNFVELVKIYENQMIPANFLPTTAENYKEIDTEKLPKISFNKAWEAFRAKFPQQRLDNMPRRDGPHRAAMTAANNAIAASAAGSSQSTVSVSASQPASPSSGARPIRILHENDHKFKVLYSGMDGTGEGEYMWEGKAHCMRYMEYKAAIDEYRALKAKQSLEAKAQIMEILSDDEEADKEGDRRRRKQRKTSSPHRL